MPSTWSKDFQDILQAKCDAWREAKKGAQREAIVNEVVKAIREQVAENERADPLPSDLAKKITNWFGNNAPKNQGSKDTASKARHVKDVTVRDVIKQSHQDQIHALIAKETDKAAGSADWLKHYPAALSKVMDALTEAEVEEAEDTMKEWNKKGVPREMQRVNAERFLADEVRSFLREIQKKTGAQLFVLCGFEKTNGAVGVTKWQTTPRSGEGFTKEVPKWKQATWDHWMDYVKEQFEDNESEDEDSDGERPTKKNDLASTIETEQKFGWPLIPARGDKSLDDLKGTIRAYVTAIYQAFTNNKRAPVPWKALSQDLNHEYIHSESLPEGQMIMDPSKLKADVISKVWKHWLQRQENDMQGLIFIKSQAGDMREKAIVKKGKKGGEDYVDPDGGSGGDEGNHSEGQNRNTVRTDGMDRGEGGSGGSDDPHPLSPFMHSGTEAERMEFLRGLSSDPVYTRYMALFPMVIGRGPGIEVKDTPDWLTWTLRTRYLPANFHRVKSMEDLMKLAKLSWDDINENAHLIMLGMGLALRDVEAANSKGDPGDKPLWVRRSTLKMQHIRKVMECWAEQLGQPGDEGSDGGDIQGKKVRPKRSGGKDTSKGKGKGRQLSPPEHSDDVEESDENGPPAKKKKPSPKDNPSIPRPRSRRRK